MFGDRWLWPAAILRQPSTSNKFNAHFTSLMDKKPNSKDGVLKIRFNKI